MAASHEAEWTRLPVLTEPPCNCPWRATHVPSRNVRAENLNPSETLVGEPLPPQNCVCCNAVENRYRSGWAAKQDPKGGHAPACDSLQENPPLPFEAHQASRAQARNWDSMRPHVPGFALPPGNPSRSTCSCSLRRRTLPQPEDPTREPFARLHAPWEILRLARASNRTPMRHKHRRLRSKRVHMPAREIWCVRNNRSPV